MSIPNEKERLPSHLWHNIDQKILDVIPEMFILLISSKITAIVEKFIVYEYNEKRKFEFIGGKQYV